MLRIGAILLGAVYSVTAMPVELDTRGTHVLFLRMMKPN